MLEGDADGFYQRIRGAADAASRSAFRGASRRNGEEPPRQESGRERVEGVPEVTEGRLNKTKISPVVLVVSRALRDHGLVHIEGMPTDEYDCCAQVAIETYEEYKRSMLRGRPETVYSSILNG